LAGRTKSEESSAIETLKELRRDFERRISDIQADIEEGRVGEAAQEALASLRKDFEHRFATIRNQIDASLEPSREVIRDRPLASIGATLASGMVVGILVGLVLARNTSES
jgi:ElaB/YqjD/DUF883 family membrane-anchored ribosome-binding protein